jgi:hypothetical protein
MKVHNRDVRSSRSVPFYRLVAVLGFGAYFPFLYGFKQGSEVDSKVMVIINDEDARQVPTFRGRDILGF